MNAKKPLIITGRSEIQGRSVETCNARDLHAFLGIRRDFAHWIRDHIRQFGFIEGQDFVTFSPLDEFDFIKLGNQSGRGGDRRSKEYALTLNMARELCMLSRTPKGKQARLYFIECERRALAAENAMVSSHTDAAESRTSGEDDMDESYLIPDDCKVTLVLDDWQVLSLGIDLRMITVGTATAIMDIARGYRVIKPDSFCTGPGYVPCNTSGSVLLHPKNGHPIPVAAKVRGFFMETDDELPNIMRHFGWSVIQSIRVDRNCAHGGDRI
ncbi:antA/AntB antirepressor family protein [Acidithiobacillus thiooxidans]|uniref:antA/AntB antirepressor family protein n=1 Tax=Acidithiobacillus thiooxidans TaxID=930 RepID=UPI001C0668C4|nr:antA/AntB antirepressor family protein [Acidithiobacillus thiooxidans]MBU2842583.1 hypothetical protein [Acidithiobacillus thiooxidans]